MSNHKHIKKVLIEEFSDELNEIFGFGKNSAISSLGSKASSGKKVNFQIKLPRRVRTELVSSISTALSSNQESIKDAISALAPYLESPDVKSFIEFLNQADSVFSINEGLKQEISSRISKSNISDVGLALIAQILTKAGMQTNISSDEVITLSAFINPDKFLPDDSPELTDTEPESEPTPTFAVPVYKKHSGSDQTRGAPQGSLVSQLVKLFAKDFGTTVRKGKSEPLVNKDKMKAVLTQIANDITLQLKGNEIKIQENRDIINEVDPAATRQFKQILKKKKEEGKYAIVKLRKTDDEKLVGSDNIWTAFMPDGTSREFDRRKYKLPTNWNDKKRSKGEASRFLNKKAKEAAENWANNWRGYLDKKFRQQPTRQQKKKTFQPVKIKVTSGKIDAKQSVARRLKNAGISLNDSEGKELVQKILSTINKFLQDNMKRINKEDIKIVSERKSL
tara:strand:+ start:4998 stop:6347 length:1350 start_codon:yes stop_codon:yes gene_type:complete